MRSLVVACVLVGFALSVVPAEAARPADSFTRHRYEASDPNFSRDYFVFAPARPAQPRAVVVYLHGCNQTAEDAALGTRWNELASSRGFFVVYPEQNLDQDVEANLAGRGNGYQCWNWFRPDLNGRDAGETGTIAGIAKTVIARHRIDPRRVYVIGASAGADLAVATAAFHPDLFVALGALAGCPYLDCGDIAGLAAYESMGPHARPMPVFAVQGTADYVNNVAMGAALVQQWLGTNDLADNGAADGSMPASPAAVEHYGVDPSALDGVGTVGDVCAYPTRHPCLGGAAGFQDSYPYSIFRYGDGEGRPLIDHWVVHGLGHAYPAGNTEANWTDPLGPDITAAAYDFFMAHPR